MTADIEATAAEDVLRAQFYGLLGELLRAPSSAELMARLARLESDESPLGAALARLGAAAATTTVTAAGAEYAALFIGMPQGELEPYASYYLTGFLYDKPLARLRADMARLGIARADSVREPEDHVASVCEMMAGLIAGAFGAPADLPTQRRFFDAHLASWGPQFFADLEGAGSAPFYRIVGMVGRLFLDVEVDAFNVTIM